MWWHPSPVTIDLRKLRKQTVSKPHCEIRLLRWPAHSSHFSLASPVAVTGQIIRQEMTAKSQYGKAWLGLDLRTDFSHKPHGKNIRCISWAHPNPGVLREADGFGRKGPEGHIMETSCPWGPRMSQAPCTALWPCRSPGNHLGNATFSSLWPCAWAPIRQIWFDSSFFPALVRFSFIHDRACAAQFHHDFSSEIVRWKRPFAISTPSFCTCLCITSGATSKTLSSSASQSWALKHRIFCTG